MKLATIVMGVSAIFAQTVVAAPTEEDFATIATLESAIAAARGILANPYGPEDNDVTKRAVADIDSLLTSVGTLDHDLTKRTLEKRRRLSNWCSLPGQPCGHKVKRSAEVIKQILKEQDLQKRRLSNWCSLPGQPCGHKVRRSLEALNEVADEILAA